MINEEKNTTINHLVILKRMQILKQVQDDTRVSARDDRGDKRFKKGFGILEVLVSSVIIIIVLSALVFVGRAALANNLYTQQKAQAVYLAQEAIEQVRQIRDTNWIDKDNTTQFNNLAWNLTNNALVPFNSTISNYYLLQVSGRWGLKTPTGTENQIPINGDTYTRDIQINSLAGTELLPGNTINRDEQSFRVTVTVGWNNNGQTKSIQVSEIMTNWRPNY